MKTSSKIFFGFWGAAALFIIGVIAAFSSVTRAWVSPDGRQLRDATHLTGPWEDRRLELADFSSVRLEGPFDITWERADTYEVVLSVPRRFSDSYATRREGQGLVFTSRLGGRYSQLALRLRVKSPTLTDVTAGESLKLKLVGDPGPSLAISGRGSVWVEGTCPAPLERLEVRAQGMTVLQMKECPLKALELEVHGSVMVNAEVTDLLEGRVHGQGEIRLKRSPVRSRLFNEGSVRVITE
jgi:hypothetical protein